MKVQVRLYGTLRERYPAYDASEGIEIEIPDGATVKDLLALLGTSRSQGALVIAEGRALKPDDTIECAAPVSVFQSIQGG